jgi:amino acid adenylation domain-containing protein
MMKIVKIVMAKRILEGCTLLHDYLIESSAKYKNKIAIKYREDSVSYEQLDIISNKVAHLLRSQGVPRGGKVGIYLSKSIEAVISIFGVLKAGLVYVPIDTDSPMDRTRYIIEDCDIKTILVDGERLCKLNKNRSLFPSCWRLVNVSRNSTVAIDPSCTWEIYGWNNIATQSASMVPRNQGNHDDLAYILYTSGSTGRPKGVMLSHRNGMEFVDWAADYTRVSDKDVFSSHAPLHFDLSIFDIFASIKVGGMLCLIPPGISYFPDAVLKFISQNGITVWYSVPSVLIQLLNSNNNLNEMLKSIRTLIYAGEVFPYQYINQLHGELSQTNIYNFYGPTETNVITAYQVKLQQGEELDRNVPIGKPCPYAHILIVDENQEPVPQGATGELIVKGASIMKGYWNNPQRTDEAIRKASSEDEEGLFYFTGDIVFEQDDGNIVYVNRLDNMVKTRGFRVELGEVESVLYKHPLIHQAAVIAIPDDKIGNYLAAFVVMKSGEEITTAEIYRYCSQFLSAYMLPTRIEIMSKLPLSENGKIDRIKLKNSIAC